MNVNWIKPVAFALALSYIIHTFVFFIAVVPSDSMVPTIHNGDRLVVMRVHNYTKLKRGDVLLFEFSEAGKTAIFVKRLIGLPGDRVEVKKGEVFVNGKKLRQNYKTIFDPGDYFSGAIKVPEGKYLFLGDNRTNSFDSRYWKDPFISRDKIIGKAVFIIYPLNRIKHL